MSGKRIYSVDVSDGHEVVFTYYQRDFTENQLAAIRHIVENAGRDPVPPIERGEVPGTDWPGEDVTGPAERTRVAAEMARQPGVQLVQVADVDRAAVEGWRELPPVAGATMVKATSVPDRNHAVAAKAQAKAQANQSGYTGEACSACLSFNVKRTGTCTVCENCGASGGCG